jgi:hypothetical protein
MASRSGRITTSLVLALTLLAGGRCLLVWMAFPQGYWDLTPDPPSPDSCQMHIAGRQVRIGGQGDWSHFGTIWREKTREWHFAMAAPDIDFGPEHHGLAGHYPAIMIDFDPEETFFHTDTALSGPWRWCFWRSCLPW